MSRLEPIRYHGIMSDTEIEHYISTKELVIDPFVDNRLDKPKGVISFGLSSFGYDLRLGTKYKVFTNSRCSIVDPKAFDSKSFIDVEGDHCLIPPNSFALAESVEFVKIPRNSLGLCCGKSTYARCGIVIPMTPLEPEWQGKVTIEISNTTPLPAKVYSNEGVCQLVLFSSPFDVKHSYADKSGKYQNQTGLTLPKVMEYIDDTEETRDDRLNQSSTYKKCGGCGSDRGHCRSRLVRQSPTSDCLHVKNVCNR